MENETMTVKEVCNYLEISRATLYRRIQQGKIKPINFNPALEKPAMLIFKRADVEKLKAPNAA